MTTKLIDPDTRETTQTIGCPECGSQRLTPDAQRGEVVCAQCGLVLEDRAIDPGPEWRAFDSEQRDRRARTGAPRNLMLHDMGLSTEIGWSDRDSSGRRIPARSRAQFHRLRRWQRRLRMRDGAQRNLALALSELDRNASRIGLPRNVRETASIIHRRAVERNLLRGRSVEAVAAASLYAACRQCGVPRTLEEVSAASRVSRKAVGRTYRFLARELKLKLEPTSPLDYVPRFASGLNLGPGAVAAAGRIIRAATEKGLTNGKSPMGMAAAALYLGASESGDPRTQKAIAEVAGVTEVTIRNHYQELTRALGLPVPRLATASSQSTVARPARADIVANRASG